VLKRMKAVEVWKRIMTEEADESEHRDASFEEGIGAFVAYRGDSTNEVSHVLTPPADTAATSLRLARRLDRRIRSTSQ
jgi:hypothetical protein